jgi:hypothetical protein
MKPTDAGDRSPPPGGHHHGLIGTRGPDRALPSRSEASSSIARRSARSRTTYLAAIMARLLSSRSASSASFCARQAELLVGADLRERRRRVRLRRFHFGTA